MTNLNVVAVPGHRALHDLPVHSGIGAKFALAGPLLKIEEVAEELEDFILPKQAQPERTAEMPLQ